MHLCVEHHHLKYLEKKGCEGKDSKGTPKTFMPPIGVHKPKNHENNF